MRQDQNTVTEPLPNGGEISVRMPNGITAEQRRAITAAITDCKNSIGAALSGHGHRIRIPGHLQHQQQADFNEPDCQP